MSVLKEHRGGVGPVSQRHLTKAVSDTVRAKTIMFSSNAIMTVSPPFLSRYRPFPLVATIFTVNLKSARGAAAAAAAADVKLMEETTR